MDIFLNWLWQGTSIALAAALALKVSRRTTAAIRCYVLWLALLLILLLPLRLLPSAVPDQVMDAPGAVVVPSNRKDLVGFRATGRDGARPRDPDV